MAEMPYEKRFGADKYASLPIPVGRSRAVLVALMCIQAGPWARPGMTAEERARAEKEISVPDVVHYLDPATAALVDDTLHLNERRAAHFGIPDPPGYVVGRLDDPGVLPRDRAELLRSRVLLALDVLLPFFADPSRPWTDEANKAAQDVRDFFPLAAEPGLWPYYKAEGKEFFAWVEKNAPVGKAPLPWEEPKR